MLLDGVLKMPLLCSSILLHLPCLKGQLFLHSLWFLLYNDTLHKEAMPHVGVPRGSPLPDLMQNTGTVPETYLQLVCLASYRAHASKVAKTICHGSQQHFVAILENNCTGCP
ncbi:unnamed protein product [Ixodes pacificus]